MTTGSRYITPYGYAYTPTGAPIPGALLNFYVSGSSTPATTYSDSGLTTTNTNPVVADSTGTFPNIFHDPAVTYKAVLTYPPQGVASPVVIWTADPLDSDFATQQYVQNELAGYAVLNAPAFTAPPTSPSPAQGDNSQDLVPSAWVRGLGLAFDAAAPIPLTTSTLLTLANLGGVAQFQAATVTVTLPACATTPIGQSMTFLGGAYGGTIQGNAAETITSAFGTPFNTLKISPNESITISSTANATTGWFVVSDSIPAVSLPIGGYTSLKSSSLGASNYVSTTTAGSIVLTNAAGGVFVAKNVNVSTNISTAGANGLDTGTVAANAWYAEFVIYNPATNTQAGLFSLSATAPTLPAGYTMAARMGWKRTGASGYLLQILQYGNKAQYVVTAGTNVSAAPQIASGTNLGLVSYTAAAVGTFVPPTASKILAIIGGSGNSAMLAPNASYGGVNSTTNPPYLQVGPGGGSAIWMTLESTNIYWGCGTTGTSTLNCGGWEDNL